MRYPMPMKTGFGAAAATAMMIFYALESRHGGHTLAFGFACFAASAYGWLAGVVLRRRRGNIGSRRV